MSDYDLLKDDVYSIRTEGAALRVTKFTKDLNPVAFYQLKAHPDGSYSCNCPQSNRGPCKHLDIVDAFDTYPERIDKGWFFCQQTGDWFPPIDDKPYNPGPQSEFLTPSWAQGTHNPPQFRVDDEGNMIPIEPPSAGGGEAVDPSTASPITPEVEETPPSPPSGVMTFSEPLKRRI